jgi:hypothetical protein
MAENISVHYKRKGLYLLITIPLFIIYFVIGAYLYSLHVIFLIIYLVFFLLTILLQSYNCLYWKCPHKGTLCPGAGGFCTFSSPIAWILLRLHVKRSRTRYNVLCTLAFINFLGIIVFPVYFLFQLHLFLVLGYFGIIMLYMAGMMFLICPSCGARQACPGGQTSTLLKSKAQRKHS